MNDIQAIYEAYARCVNERRWQDLLNYVTEPLSLNGQDVSAPQEVADRIRAAGGRVEMTIDATTSDGKTPTMGAYVVVRLDRSGEKEKSEEPVITIVEQHLVWTNARGKIYKIVSLPDVESLTRQISDPGYRPAPDIVSSDPSGGRGTEKLSVAQLDEKYRAYVDCINNRTMEADLPKFCHGTVVHNARRLSLEEYRGLMEDAQDAIPDIRFGAAVVVPDGEAQRVAVRIEFTGTPAKTFAGVEPNGKSVQRFCEHVTYHFVDGKISRVWSIVDLRTYRQEISQ